MFFQNFFYLLCLEHFPPHFIFFWEDLLTCPATPDLCCAQNYLPKQNNTPFLDPSLPSSGAQKQQLLEFPHDLEVEDPEDDMPRRKNRAKGKVSLSNLPPSSFPSRRVPLIACAVFSKESDMTERLI